MREKEKPPRPVKKKKAQGADLREPKHPRFALPIGTLYSGCKRVTLAVLLFVLSSSACKHPAGNFGYSTQSAGREQTMHSTRPFAPNCTIISSAAENNRLPVVLGLQPALFFVAGDTVFLFFREKKYGVAKKSMVRRAHGANKQPQQIKALPVKPKALFLGVDRIRKTNIREYNFRR